MDWLTEHLPNDSDIKIKSLTNEHTILVLAGPKSRDVLAKAAPRSDVSKASLPWLSVKTIHISQAPVITMSVSFSAELAYELHIPNASLLLVHELIMAAGKDESISYFGMRAVESMRLEKGYMHWKADLITEFNPFEIGLDRFIKMDKDFIGKEALVKMQNEGLRRKLVCLKLSSKTAPAHGGDSVIQNGKVVGTITSTGWGHRVGKNLAYAFVEPEVETGLSVLMLGNEVEAEVCEMGIYDSEHLNVRQ